MWYKVKLNMMERVVVLKNFIRAAGSEDERPFVYCDMIEKV